MTTQANNFVPYIPDNAPFSPTQRQWLNGFLAGLYSNANAAQVPSLNGAAHAQPEPLAILFGSQTGNAEAAAKKLFKRAKADGFNAELFSMDAYPPERLNDDKNLLLITSTYGEGDPPDNAEGFFELLHSSDAPKLDSTRFSVMGLGDSNYPDFNVCAKKFDTRLEQLGATRVAEGVFADVDFDDDFDRWQAAVLPALKNGTSNGVEPSLVAETDAVEAPKGYTRSNPFAAPVLANINLNGEGSAKETRHVELSLEGSGLEYEAGDALGVYPKNRAEMVASILSTTGLNGSDPIEIKGETLALHEALSERLDITTLNAKLTENYATFSGSSSLTEMVRNGGDNLKNFLWGRQWIDLLEDFPATWESPQQLVDLLKPMPARLYSISSSPKAHPGEVHVTVGVVSYEAHNRARHGVCSNFLAGLKTTGSVPVFIQPNKVFKVPADGSRPLIMVGPGTGIAPFRAFLEERKATGATGKNWLYFGDQKGASDFLYREELEAMQSTGVLTRLDTAFSRDQKDKIYVQHRMKENAKELYAWLEEGASFCVCGDASRMAKDVDQALHEVISEAGGCTTDQATEYVARLKSEKRYLRDVY